MFNTIISAIKDKTLRNRILFTLGALIVFRFGATLTVPGVTLGSDIEQGSIFEIMNMLGGGALNQFSLFALGVSPYITASIIIQVLSMDVIPSLSQLAKSGEKGKRELQKTTKWLALVLSLVQSFALTYVMQQQGIISFDDNVQTYIFIMVILTAGASLTVWMGDKISEKGIGNGLSMIIFAGIVANLPYQIYNTYTVFVDAANAQSMFTGLLNFGFYMIAFVAVIAVMIFFGESERRIPIQYAHKHEFNKKEEVPYLPIKVNTAGVIPVIFASAMVTAPVTIAAFFPDQEWAWWVNKNLQLTSTLGITLYILLIVAFSFFQSHSQVDGKSIADNFQKSAAYIPGIRPGKETEKYISHTVTRLTILGAIFLVVIATLPLAIRQFSNYNPSLTIGGTSMIIVVGVAIETVRQVKGRITSRNYEEFIDTKDVQKAQDEFNKSNLEW